MVTCIKEDRSRRREMYWTLVAWLGRNMKIEEKNRGRETKRQASSDLLNFFIAFHLATHVLTLPKR